jgi:hypothetical protein
MYGTHIDATVLYAVVVLCCAVLWLAVQVAEDYRIDPQLYSNCKDSVVQLCKQHEPGKGEEIDCLVSVQCLGAGVLSVTASQLNAEVEGERWGVSGLLRRGWATGSSWIAWLVHRLGVGVLHAVTV